MDKLDRAIINRLQQGLPIVLRPYSAVAEELGITEAAVLRRLQTLMKVGVLSRVGPLFDIERAGGAYCLCAVQVPNSDFDEVAAIINHFDEVTHSYEREHRFNLWFLLATEDPTGIEAMAKSIEIAIGHTIHLMPREEVYYVGLHIKA